MKINSLLTFKLFVLLILTQSTVFAQEAKEIFINPNSGNDQNIGSKEQPLKTLNEAAERVNHANGKGAITIYLSEGIYGLHATVTFHPGNWHFSKDDQLTIRATVLPDDTVWNPGMMPVIVSTMPLDFKPNGRQDPLGGASYGIQTETSYVTIQGLRILGTPVHERPKEGMVRRNYPIVREGRNLDDLRITQCLFVGDKVAIPNHLAILASGQGVVVDHCLFYHVFSNAQWVRLHESHSKDVKVNWPDGHFTLGIEKHIQDLAAMFVYAPDTRIKQHPIRFGNSTGEWTAVTGIMEGTFSKPMPIGNGKFIQPTGKSFKLPMCTIGHWVNGIMNEEYLFWDNQTYMNQLGLGK